MTTLAIDKSTSRASIALAKDGAIAEISFEDRGKGGEWVGILLKFLAEHGIHTASIDRFIIGMGPGSFAGTRAALAFAQGAVAAAANSAPHRTPAVYGLPSGAGCTEDGLKTAVIGDARRGLYWVNLWDGANEVEPCHLASALSIPAGFAVKTSDYARIGARTGAQECPPSAKRLVEVAAANPAALVQEPLPIYLSPAVR
ncbi:MAG: tRNA (adenosine(37)-N6)-threonylcarbamoyltransferase complex dimerization subunit type 1 TsaB [Kiritimatiellae bacterium]|nr:tRNA (adenosine(37)-N6)-threonylcarbamoyltransferase complex dimerization subunit type 1 TsaB [Kiritimatiellia bacterium]